MHKPLHLPTALQLQKVAMAIYKQTEKVVFLPDTMAFSLLYIHI